MTVPSESWPGDPGAQPTASPAPAGEPVLERPHPLTPLARGWIAIVAVLVFILRDLPDGGFQRVRETGWLLAAILGGVLLISVLVGYLNWRFTRFIIDDEQVRIERRFISLKSERIAFTKIQSVDIVQPMIARILGLAALRIDVGSQGSAKSIEFLGRNRAYQLRDYLVSRAHGTRTTLSGSAQKPTAGIFEDVSVTDRMVVRVPIPRLIGSMAASPATILLMIFVMVQLGVLIATRSFLSLAGTVFIVPWLLGIGSWIVARLRNEFNFVLTMTPDGGLRTSSGLTSLTSQTIPRNRVQAIDITQPLLWRPFGWYRVRLDMLGVGGGDESTSRPSDLLLPVGTRADVDAVLAALWPRLNLPGVPLQPIPKQARWLRWLDAQTFFWGHDEQVLVSRGGLLRPRTSIVPHVRVQSVRLIQGPWQRRLGLASVQAHTTRGPVDVVCRHLAVGDARLLTMTELDRMRHARANPELSLIVPPAQMPPPPLVPGYSGYPGYPPPAPGYPETPDYQSPALGQPSVSGDQSRPPGYPGVSDVQ